jgi:very-short-patch-repair endonuclease
MRGVPTGRPSWSKGLTKETHPTLALISQKVSIAQIGKTINDAQREGLALGRAWGKGRTKETCPVVAARSKYLSRIYTGRANPEHGKRLKALYARRPDLHPNSIVGRKTKGKGYTHIETIVADILRGMNVPFGFNVRIGSKWPDFSIPTHMLIVEADGERWHQDADKESARDAYLNALGWTVLHLTGKQLVNETDKCRTLIAKSLAECNV